jgi:hypothetical protein
MLDVKEVPSTSDPKTVKYCSLSARQQLEFAPGEGAEITLDTLNGMIQVYCSLFRMDGAFLMSDMDTVGNGKVVCNP